jgi:hypothetical protein
VVDFVERVEEWSGGDLRLETVDEWGDFASDAEQQVVKDVAAGEVDLGWAARASSTRSTSRAPRR